MTVISRKSGVLLGVVGLISACGGLDTADTDNRRSQVNSAETNDGEGSDESPNYERLDLDELDPACYDPDHRPHWEFGGFENPQMSPRPDTGCTYEFSGDEQRCEGRWVCCGNEYLITFDRDASTRTSTTNVSLPDGSSGQKLTTEGRSLVPGEPPREETCPLIGEVSWDLSAAAATAASWFDYTPAWEQAVRESRGETVEPGELEPMPLGCTLSMADYGCEGQLSCPEHVYEVRVGLEGELHCSRDGEEVAPFDDVVFAQSCRLETAGDLSADSCFGPGWRAYFELAAMEQQ